MGTPRSGTGVPTCPTAPCPNDVTPLGSSGKRHADSMSADATYSVTMTTYLFDSWGNWIAFRRTPDDKYLFNTNGDWIGWFPWGDEHAVTRDGDYLGSVAGNRLLRGVSQPQRGYPGSLESPESPGYPGYPGYPGLAGYQSTPSGYHDVPAELLKGE